MTAEVIAKERPIIFSGEMVRAILDGRKTQTRRAIKFVDGTDEFVKIEGNRTIFRDKILDLAVPDYAPHLLSAKSRYEPGDRLWVRETFFYEWPDEDPPDDMRDCRIVYRASEPDYITSDMRESESSYRWSSSIHMPRWASRITLEITGVRVESLQAISVEDILSEGCRPIACDEDASEIYEWYSELWDSINAKRGYSWEDNPWVWVIEFKRITP